MQFDHYNFVSCIYNDVETIFVHNKETLGNHYLDDRPVEEQYHWLVDNAFNFQSDTMIVYIKGYKYSNGHSTIVNHIKKCSPKKLIVFNDDAHTPWQELDLVIDELKGKTHEGLLISYLIAESCIEDYQIYDCEYGALSYYHSNIEADRYHYYNIWTHSYAPHSHNLLREYKPTKDMLYKLCCCSKKPDIHRALAAICLVDKEDVKLTYYEKHRFQELERMISFTNTDKVLNPPLPTYKTLPEKYKTLIQNNYKKFLESDLTWDVGNISDIAGHEQVKTISLSRDSFLTVVPETLWDTSTRFWSEKTLKPMLMKRPFVLLAPAKTLDKVRRLGFQTFGNYWDESYDEELDHGKRFAMVMDIANDILKKDWDELLFLLNDMEGILEHNRKQVWNLSKRKLI